MTISVFGNSNQKNSQFVQKSYLRSKYIEEDISHISHIYIT